VAIRLPAGSTVNLITTGNARAVAGVLFIDVPATLDSYLLEPILSLGRSLEELAQACEEEEVK
jgi:DNA helicase TIP49 (TBP-interacting protein)